MKEFKSLLSIILIISTITLFGYPAETENVTISTDGVKIKFDVQGNGELAVVFVHGWAGYRSGWDRQMSYFSQKYKVVSIDLAGFGESGNNRKNWTMDAFGEDVVSVIKHLNIKKAVIVGQSMGAAVILEAAIRIPGRVIGLVPVDMFQNVESKRTKEEMDEFEKRLMNNVNNPDEKRLRSAFKREIDPRVIKRIIHNYKSSAKVGWRETLRAFMLWMSNDLTGVLEKNQAPIYCINSDRRFTDLKIARKYAASFNAKIIKGVGHAVMAEVPDEFNRSLEEIIQEFNSTARTLYLPGTLYNEKGDKKKALEYFKKISETVQDIGYKVFVEIALKRIKDIQK
jgi:pimeloyl-ACP methyl ester carboxylesterase